MPLRRMSCPRHAGRGVRQIPAALLPLDQAIDHEQGQQPGRVLRFWHVRRRSFAPVRKPRRGLQGVQKQNTELNTPNTPRRWLS